MQRYIAFVLGLYLAAAGLLLLAGRLWPEAHGAVVWQLCLAAVIVFWPAQAVWRIEAKSPPRLPATMREKVRALLGGVIAGAVSGVLAWLVKEAMVLGNGAFESRAWPIATMLLGGVIVLVVPGVIWVWLFPAAQSEDEDAE